MMDPLIAEGVNAWRVYFGIWSQEISLLYEKIEYQVVKNRKELFILTFMDMFAKNFPNSCFRDLSYNDLTGSVPEFLAQLPHLTTL